MYNSMKNTEAIGSFQILNFRSMIFLPSYNKKLFYKVVTLNKAIPNEGIIALFDLKSDDKKAN